MSDLPASLVPPTTAPVTLAGPLVVRSPNWLGDAVMALAAVRNLKTLVGSEPLAVAAPEKLAALWEACPFVDRVLSLARPKSLWATAAQLREGKFGAAVLLPNSLRSAAEARLARIPQRLGYTKRDRRFLLTHAVPVPPQQPLRLHQRFYYLDLVRALGGPDDATPPSLRVAAASPESVPTVAICPGAEYGPAKRWPVDRFAVVAKHFQEKLGAKIVVLGAAADVAIAETFVKLVPEAENRVGKTSLSEFMAALQSARLVVCNDSGAMHVAAALGTPTVAVFGSTEPLLTGPLGASADVVRHHVPCSPCFLRDCPIDFACMLSVAPDRVIAAGEALLRG